MKFALGQFIYLCKYYYLLNNRNIRINLKIFKFTMEQEKEKIDKMNPSSFLQQQGITGNALLFLHCLFLS